MHLDRYNKKRQVLVFGSDDELWVAIFARPSDDEPLGGYFCKTVLFQVPDKNS